MPQGKQVSLPVTIQVNIPEHLRAGISANIINVTTTNYGEVLFDFIFAHPNDKTPDGKNSSGILVSRVVLPLQTAKDLQIILTNHLGKIQKE